MEAEIKESLVAVACWMWMANSSDAMALAFSIMLGGEQLTDEKASEMLVAMCSHIIKPVSETQNVND